MGSAMIQPKEKWRGVRPALRPALLLAQFWGLSPVTIDAVGEPRIANSPCSIAVRLLSVVTLIGSISLKIIYSPHANIQQVATTAVYTLDRVMGVANYVYLYFHQSTVIAGIRCVVAMDDKLPAQKSARTVVFTYIQIIVSLVYLVPQVIQGIKTLYYTESLQYVLFVAWDCATNTAALDFLVLQWVVLVVSLVYQMDYLIAELTKIYVESRDVNPSKDEYLLQDQWMFLLLGDEFSQSAQLPVARGDSMRKSSLYKNIPALRRIHRHIYYTLQRLQVAYGASVTFTFASIILNTVANVIELAKTKNFFYFWWILFCGVVMFLVVTPCQMLLDKVHKCADLIHSTMQNDIAPQKRKQVLGTIVTYVIILIQFESPAQVQSSQTANITNCTIDYGL